MVDFVAKAERCAICGSTLRNLKSSSRLRPVHSLQAGSFIPRRVLKQCTKDRSHPVTHPETLAKIVKPNQRYAFDLVVHVGMARYLRNKRREDIRAELYEQRGIKLSVGSVSNLCDRFLNYLEALHLARAPYLRAAMQRDGYPLHLDATNDRGKGGVLVCMDGFRGWVLVAGKIPSEAEEHLRPLVEKTVAMFGDPISTMRDLMKAGPNTVAPIRERGKPDLLCHYHFLRAVAIKLFDALYSDLQGLLKQSKLRSDSRELLRELRRYRKSASYKGRFGSGQVGEGLLALVHWVIEGDGKKKLLYPFSLPPVELLHRCRQAMQRAEGWVPSPRTQPESRALRHFGGIVARVDQDNRFAEKAGQLENRWRVFCELRDVLRLTDAGLPRGDTRIHQTELPAQAQQNLQAIEKTTKEYIQRLRDKVGSHGKRKAVTPSEIILKYLKRYGDGLFGHPVVRDEDGAVIAVVERTNNIIEQFFDKQKRHLRRRLGKAHLGRDLEDQPAQAFLAANLCHDDYVRVLCGSLGNLAEAFANLDQKALTKATPLVRENRDSDIKCRVRALLERDAHHSGLGSRVVNAQEILLATTAV